MYRKSIIIKHSNLLHMKKLFLFGTLAVFMAACSSNDDFQGNESVTPNLTSASDYAFVKSDGRIMGYADYIGGNTRAVAQDVITELGVTAEMPAAPSVPSDAKSLEGVAGYNTQSNTKYFIPAGVTYDGSSINLNGDEFYVQGTLDLGNHWGTSTWTGSGQVPAKIYVLPGGTLNYNSELALQFNLYNYGTLNYNNAKNELYISTGTGALYNYGDLDLGDDIDFRANGSNVYIGGDVNCKNFRIEKDAKCYVAGDLILKTDLNVQQTLVVQGKVEAPNISLEAYTKFAAGCKVITPGLFNINSNESRAWINYLSAGNVYACAGSKIYLADGGMVEVAGAYKNENNGNDAALILLGNNARGVVKANIIANNAGNGVTQDLFAYRTEQPETGSELALVADKFYFINNNHELGNELQKSNINLQPGVLVEDDDLASFSMAPTDCAPGFNYNDGDPEKDDNTPDVVVVPPVHKYSATALDFGPNGELYLCWHSNIGNGQGGNGTNMYVTNADGSSVSVDGINDWGGIIDVINTNNYGDPQTYLFDQTLIQNEHKYNHVLYYGGKLYLASTSKKVGAAMHEIALNADGTINEGEFSAKNVRVNLTGSSANSAIIKNDELITISGFNNGAINKFPIIDFSNQEKKAIVSGEGFTGKYIYNDGTYIITLNNVKEGTVTLYDQNMNFVRTFNVGALNPEDGKNVIVGDGSKIYICRGNNGLAVYDYNGNRVGGSRKTANGVDVDDKYIYVAGGYGLVVLDRNETYMGTDKNDPEKEVAYNKTVKRFTYSGTGNSRYDGVITDTDPKQSANFVKVRNGKAYVAYGMYGLQIYDVSELVK